MEKIKLIALIGQSGAGKDSVLKKVLEGAEWHRIVNSTTRPPRQGEVDGVDYHFLDNEVFTTKLLNYEMIEATTFNSWGYGTELSELEENNINIGVFNPNAVEILLSDKRIDLKVIEILATDKQRIIRQLNRVEDPDIEEIFRRYRADMLDFADIDFELDYLFANNEMEDIGRIAERIIEAGNNWEY